MANDTGYPMKWSGAKFNMIDNYIYFYHLDKFILLPTYPESVQDNMSVNFVSNTPLARSAPIYSYANSGPRGLTINFELHRDMMQDINYNRSNYVLENLVGNLNDMDYVDAVIKCLQAAAVPKYEASTRTVKPPIIAIRLGSEIFCKGVISGSVQVTHAGPLLSYPSGEKYAMAKVSFAMNEIDPFSAENIMVNGTFRGFNNTLERGLFKVTDVRGIGNRATSKPIERLV